MKKQGNAKKTTQLGNLRTALLRREEEKNARWQAGNREDDLLEELFQRDRETPSLEDFENFVRLPTSANDGGFAIGHGQPSEKDIRTASHTALTYLSNSVSKLNNAFADDTRSIASVQSGGTLRRRRNKPRKSDVSSKPQIYAGITHSDLDIQYYRPPLMHQMNVIEWLWLQSANFHRINILILALLICIVLANVVFASIIFFGKDESAKSNPYVCETSACKDLGKRILKTLNKSWDPCVNFYAFACGTDGLTPGLTDDEENYWDFGENYGRIRYDFRRSISLGRLFRKKKRFPETLILPFYKGCLNEASRNSLKLQPFYGVLRKVGLYSVSKAGQHTMQDVIHSMASILSQSFKTAAMLQDKYYMANGSIRMFVSQSVPDSYKSGGVIPYGYDNYRETIKNSFLLLSELNVPIADLDIIAHDIICLELAINDRVKIPPGKSNILEVLNNDPSVAGKKCPLRTDLAADIPGNFGQPAGGTFDWDLFVMELYSQANPGYTPGSPIPIQGNPSEDDHVDQSFISEFNDLLKQSAPHRLLRYMQWRLFYDLSFDLDDAAIKTTLQVRRHHFTGVPSCVQRLFTWLPLATPESYLHSFTGFSPLEIEQEFAKMMQLVRTTYYKIISRSRFKEYEKYINRQLEPRELRLVREIIASSMRTDDVIPVSYEDRFFRRFPELYKDIKFSEGNHFQNLMKMGYRLQQWRLTEPYSSIFFDIHPRYHTPIWMDKPQVFYEREIHRNAIYLPFATVEVPHFHGGLVVSDIGGAGWVYAGTIERASISSLVRTDAVEGGINYLTDPHFRDLLNENYTVAEIRATMTSLKTFVTEHYYDRWYIPSYLNGWKVGASEKWEFRYNYTIRKAMEFPFVDQKRYHVLTTMMDEYLAKPENWKHRKALLEGLEQYNAKQLFYISAVGRRCDQLGRKKFDHLKVFGPISRLTRTNIALSNLDHFAKTFKCPVGSPMNPDPSQKLYYWDRDVNLTKFSFNESAIEFLNSG